VDGLAIKPKFGGILVLLAFLGCYKGNSFGFREQTCWVTRGK